MHRRHGALLARYERLAKEAEAAMLDTMDLTDPERLSRMMRFYLVHGYQLGLYANGLHFEGDLEAIQRNGFDIEHTDFSTIFDEGDKPPGALN